MARSNGTLMGRLIKVLATLAVIAAVAEILRRAAGQTELGLDSLKQRLHQDKDTATEAKNAAKETAKGAAADAASAAKTAAATTKDAAKGAANAVGATA